MSPWLAGLIEGLPIALAAAWFTSWFGSRDRFRDRMIDATRDFGDATSEALVALRDAIGVVRKGSDVKLMETVSMIAWRKRDEVLKRSEAIDWFFQTHTPASAAAGLVVSQLAEAINDLRPPTQDPDAAERGQLRATEALISFHSLAFDALRLAHPSESLVDRVTRGLGRQRRKLGQHRGQHELEKPDA